jgi:hypothetical protein
MRKYIITVATAAALFAGPSAALAANPQDDPDYCRANPHLCDTGTGQDGASAYQIWLDNGHAGTEVEFLNWLKGQDGADGADGQSAYQIWLECHEGSEGDFLNWLRGPAGHDGQDGRDGQNGSNGSNGSNGVDGAKGETGATGATGANGSAGTTTVVYQYVIMKGHKIGDTRRVIHAAKIKGAKLISMRASMRNRALKVRHGAVTVDLRGKSVGNYNVYVTARYRKGGHLRTVRFMRVLSVQRAMNDSK